MALAMREPYIYKCIRNPYISWPNCSRCRPFCKFSIALLMSSYVSALPAHLQYFCAFISCSAVRLTLPGAGTGADHGWTVALGVVAGITYG